VDLRFIERVIKTTLIFSALLFPFLAVYFKINLALAVLFGAIWGCLNLLGIKIIIVHLVTSSKPNWLIGSAVLFLKLPVLYFVGYLLLAWDIMPTVGLLLGFSAVFIVAVLKVVSRAILGLDKKQGEHDHSRPLENKA
jgi:hypothetical protein